MHQPPPVTEKPNLLFHLSLSLSLSLFLSLSRDVYMRSSLFGLNIHSPLSAPLSSWHRWLFNLISALPLLLLMQQHVQLFVVARSFNGFSARVINTRTCVAAPKRCIYTSTCAQLRFLFRSSEQTFPVSCTRTFC